MPVYLEFSTDGCLAVVNSGSAPNTGSLLIYGPDGLNNYSLTTTIAGMDSPVNASFKVSGTCIAIGSQLQTITIYSKISGCTFNTTPTTTLLLGGFNGHPKVAFSPAGCLATTNSPLQDVEIFSPLVADSLAVTIVPSSVTACIGDTINLIALASGGTPGYTFSWTGPNGFTSNSAAISIPSAQLSDTGAYQVTVTDSTLAQANNSVTVTVNDCNPTPPSNSKRSAIAQAIIQKYC